ncbi:MAG: transcriptional regulator, partial [Candidatus Portnoybacteria bacterium]|nr:transcriptional regulator [Candidatus Portnoybacteria bacterium]
MNKQKLKFILQQGEGLGIEFKESIGSLAQEFENILIVEVKESKNKPYKCSSGFYLRQGANSQKMTRDEILDFAVGEGKIRFDEQINKEFGFPRDFDEEKFKSFLKENNLFTGLEVKDVLVNLGLALKNGKKIFLNNAGVLFFSKDPQRFFIHAYLDCVLFKGKDKSEVIDRKIFRLGLLEQLSSAKKFVKRHLNLSYEFNDFERKETYEIPLRAIEEALVNALMHRDYFFKGANISLFIYGDRVEVVSPGGLP